MRKINQFIFCFLFSAGAFAQTEIKKPTIAIIPEPVSVTEKAGTFKLPENQLEVKSSGNKKCII